MVTIYRLTSLGESLAHNPNAERTPGRLVVYYLAKRGAATSEQLYNSIPNLTPYKIGKLVRSRVIYSNEMQPVD
jgi:hypothetical protein